MNPRYRWCVDEVAYEALTTLTKRRARQVTVVIEESPLTPFERLHSLRWTRTDSNSAFVTTPVV